MGTRAKLSRAQIFARGAGREAWGVVSRRHEKSESASGLLNDVIGMFHVKRSGCAPDLRMRFPNQGLTIRRRKACIGAPASDGYPVELSARRGCSALHAD